MSEMRLQGRKLAAAIIATCLVAGCGSGIGSGTGSSGNGSGTSMSVTKAEVTPAASHLGQQVAVHWTVDYATPAAGYTAEFHLNNQPSLIEGMSGLTRVFSANGDLGPLTVGKDATINCTLQLSGGSPAISCGSYGTRYLNSFNLTQPLYGIIKACTYDASMQQVCDTRATGPLNFQFSSAKLAANQSDEPAPAQDASEVAPQSAQEK